MPKILEKSLFMYLMLIISLQRRYNQMAETKVTEGNWISAMQLVDSRAGT